MIAKQIREETGLSISTGYLWMLRTGQRGNPTGSRLQALARFFGKPTAYFLDQEVSDKDMDLAAALRTHGVKMIALRSEGLSEQSQRAILELVERARQIEKLMHISEKILYSHWTMQKSCADFIGKVFTDVH